LSFRRREDDIIASCDRITGGKRQPIDVGRVLITRSNSSRRLDAAGHTPAEQQQQQQQQREVTATPKVKYFVNICSCGVGATTPPIVNKLKWLRTLCE
jgi:diacylglycerol kinase family enzyme